jgi:hypothetical protein
MSSSSCALRLVAAEVDSESMVLSFEVRSLRP